MSDTSPQKELPAAIPVERETLRKARVELQDLPAAIPTPQTRDFANDDLGELED
ncbi:hypothetical protein [Roseibacillus ishigakijimensis]|uniref:Uncharacterized protein n=1 Tax=Roseibacillus ishigakijimensis TaxID=454146 RepID=A0A934VMJ6_9BACT|nr:hypothetical protein [Roseibacillus ishigakijimensis]MBK1834020.1 hypothetical protein [Roseibacillus ishigakijimensis]